MNDMPGAPDQIDYSQSNRYLRISTELGEDALVLTAVEGADKVSTPFLFTFEFTTWLPDDTVRTLLGKSATLFLCHTQESAPRPVNGLVRKLSGPSTHLRGFSLWRAELVPQLAFLGYTTDCRIFQNKTVLQIIETVFEAHGLRHYETRNLMGSYPALDYCVQYRETALNFVCRLMEHNGLFFWHEHEDGQHTLIITDMMQAAKPATDDTLRVIDSDQFGAIRSLTSDYQFRPGKVTLKDYDFVNPDSALLATTPTMISDSSMASYEVFDYPGIYTSQGIGAGLSRVRMELEETKYHRLQGHGTVAAFDAGRRASIMVPNGSSDDTETNFFIVSVRHHARDMTHVTAGVPASYVNDFVVITTDYPFRPERVSHKPFMRGPQTARVTGPAGEHIYTDEYGRVKVRFHWDRNPDGDADEQSSCWLRVSQYWANGGWGAIHIPRIGEEVIVDFLEGDPDQPIITGRVYNGSNKVPYALPANKTQSGIKSQSVPSGGSNEFRFEDKQGAEEVWLHAQKDFNQRIENNETVYIGNDESRHVMGTLTETIEQAVTETYNDTLVQSVKNSITVTCPNVTYNASQTMKINTPSTTEAKNSDITAGAYKLSAYGIGMNAYAAYMNVYAFKMDLTGLKIDLAVLAIKNAPVEFECVKAKIKVIDGYIKSSVTKVESALTSIKDGAMFAITYAVVMFP